MKLKLYLVLIILIFLQAGLRSQTDSSWPDGVRDIQQSICLVEYFQPQFEMGEMTDKSRIKKKITGILVDNRGLVITSDIIFPANLDIVESNFFYLSNQPMPEDITVSFKRNKKLKAQFIGKDEDLRMAFIRITDTDDLPDPVEFEADSDLLTGAPVYLIQHLSNQFDYEKIVTVQNVNAIIEKPNKKILTLSSVSPLSAGGLVMDDDGNALGCIFRSNIYYNHYDYQYENNYAGQTLVQITPADQFIPLFKNPPTIVTRREGSGKSWFGIQMQILSKEMAAYWELNDTNGIVINKVLPGSPAELSGLRSGDILLSFDDLQVKGYDKKNLDILRTFVRKLPEGDITIHILRDKKPKTLTVTLKSAPISRFLAEEYSDKILGFGVKELTQDYIINNELEFDTEGVWVSRVEDGGGASIAGIDVNDLILRIDDQQITDLKEFENYTSKLEIKKDEYIQVFLKRYGKTHFVYIKPMQDN